VKHIKNGKGRAVFSLTIHEGRKRQVRRMCKAIGHPVLELFRTRIGPITIGRLAPGEYRNLTRNEIEKLRTAVGM
jgi:pseudouridine synthase